jgi:alpha-galactosidase
MKHTDREITGLLLGLTRLPLSVLMGVLTSVSLASVRAEGPAFHRSWAERFFAAPSACAWHSPRARHEGGLPFSFVYGGRPLAELAGTWGVKVRQEDAGGNRLVRVLTLTDPNTNLEVRAEATVYTDTGGVDWILHLTNRGKRDTPIIEHLQAVDWTIAPGGKAQPILHRLNGGTSTVDDWLPLEDVLPPGKRVEFGPSGPQANSSSGAGACPFFNLQWDGGGVITAIGWTAPWHANVQRSPDGALRLQAGMQQMRLKLHPGETVRSPRILQFHWLGGDPMQGCNQFRRVMLAHILPQRDGRAITPPIAHTSVVFWEENACTESAALSHLDSIRGLRFEVFWLDAYWIRDGYPKGTGHYGFPIQRVEPKDRFPRGLKPIGEAVHRQGLKFLVWFSPESIWAGGDLGREHPEWTTFWEKDKPLADWGQFDLGIPEAREFMTRYLATVIREYGMDWLRIDSGMIPAFAREKDRKAADRAGMTEIRYVEGLYRMWDELRARFPHLAIDNCFGGGRRIDLETCSRSLPLWRTDITYDLIRAGKKEQMAVLNQSMTAGLSRYVPFSVCTQMGTTPYMFRSGFNGGITFSDDCRVAGYPRDLLKSAIAEGQRIRKYYFGNFYPLVPVTNRAGDWCVLQYHLPGRDEGMILAFRRHHAGATEMTLSVREIVPTAPYEVTQSHGYERLPPVRLQGAELQQMRVAIPERPGSVLIEYRRIGG